MCPVRLDARVFARARNEVTRVSSRARELNRREFARVLAAARREIMPIAIIRARDNTHIHMREGDYVPGQYLRVFARARVAPKQRS